MDSRPVYLMTHEKGTLANKVDHLYSMLESCELCPRKCGANRLKNEFGYCQSGKMMMISSYGPHFGEENVLVGRLGSGTIFLSGCNLRCVYCQNYSISHLKIGESMSEEQVSALKSRHAELEEILENEVSRPHPDQNRIAGLKKQKLRIKDELVELGVH